MDLALKTETFGADDQRWLATAHGTDDAQGITLQANLFTEGTHYPDGFLKSGIVLGEVTATGFYGPYDNGAVDGRETAAGILFTPVSLPASGVTADTEPGGAMLDHCIVVEANLIGIDANGKAELTHVIFR